MLYALCNHQSVITEEEELPTRNEEEAQAPIDTDRLVVIGAHPEKAAGFIEAVIVSSSISLAMLPSDV